MNKKSTAMNKNVKLGIFTITGLIIFVVTLYYLGSRSNLFGSQIRISADFTNASGIQEGSNVRLAGVKVGTVHEVKINSDSSVTIGMMLDNNSAQFVKKDAKVTIGTEGLMGNKIINISEGTVGAGAVEEGDVLKAGNEADLANIMQSVLTNSRNLQDITNNLVTVTDKLMKGEGAIGKLLFDTAVEKQMHNVILSLEKSGSNAVALTARLQDIVAGMENGKGMAGRLLTDPETAGQFDTMMDSLKRVTEEAGYIARQLSDFSDMLNNEKGAINRLLTDTVMADNLEATIANVKERSAELEETIQIVNSSWILNLFSGNKKKNKHEKKGQKSASAKLAE